VTASALVPTVTAPPDGADWWTWGVAVEQAASWLPDLAAREGDRRAAGAYLAGWLARAPMQAIGLPAVLDGVALELAADRLFLHRHPDGWFDQHAVQPDRVVEGDADDVLVLAGTQVARLTQPAVVELCAHLPVGPIAVWGGVADALAAYALLVARDRGDDGPATWRRVEVVLDAVQDAVPALRHRPRLFPVTWSGGEAHYPVRATCCLWYRTTAAACSPEPYCTTCPLRADDHRRARLVAHLEATAQPAG
jgi:hypothetical protein